MWIYYLKKYIIDYVKNSMFFKIMLKTTFYL